MKRRYRFLTIVFMSIAIASLTVTNSATAKSRKKGIGLSVTDSNPIFLFRFFVSNSISIEPTFAFRRVTARRTDLLSNGNIRWNPGLGVIHHGRIGSDFRPFAGVRAALDILAGKSKVRIDKMFSPVFGGEFFVSENLSIAGEYQLNITFTDKNVSPSIDLRASSTYYSTAQLLTVNFYF